LGEGGHAVAGCEQGDTGCAQEEIAAVHWGELLDWRRC
jgi:hypothetical protein